MKIKKYNTSYVSEHKKYGSHIYARSFREAQEIAKSRNIGEKIMGVGGVVTDGYNRVVPEELINPDFRELTDNEFVHELPKIIHSACFLGLIAVSSGTANVNDLLGDNGVVHELVHLLNGSSLTTRNIRRARGRFYKLQDKAIGNFKPRTEK
jgi:hypothetical protein